MTHSIRMFSLCMILPCILSAQIKSDTLSNGSVYNRDIRFDLLVSKRAEINQLDKSNGKVEVPTKGYRVQAMSTSNRNDVINAKAKVLSAFPQHKVYLLYQAPNFKLRVGNFTEKEDAVALRNQLAKILPPGIIVIPSDIELSKKEQELYKMKAAQNQVINGGGGSSKKKKN